jgi:hypothetical protein
MIFEGQRKNKVYHSEMKKVNKQYPWLEVFLPYILRILGLKQTVLIIVLYMSRIWLNNDGSKFLGVGSSESQL